MLPPVPQIPASIHPVFTDRPASCAKLWRYLSAPKLLALLELKYLHFTRIDKFDDHFEGAWPATQLAHTQAPGGHSGGPDAMRTKIAALCWVECEQESAAMWRMHTPDHNSVAITTNFGAMEALMRTSSVNEYCDVMNVARVNYADPSAPLGAKKTGMVTPHALSPFMTKNISYRHECEVRALAVSKPNYEIEASGLDIEIDLFNFIHHFVINPFCDQWFVSMLYGVLTKYNVEKKLRYSSLTRMNAQPEMMEMAQGA